MVLALVVFYLCGVLLSYLTCNIGVTRLVRRQYGLLRWKGYFLWPVILFGLFELYFGDKDRDYREISRSDFIERESKKGEDEPIGRYCKGVEYKVTIERIVSPENIRAGNWEGEEYRLISIIEEGKDPQPIWLIENPKKE